MTERTVKDVGKLSGWRKSSYSNSDGGSCVEVPHDHPTDIPVRDSRTPHGPALIFPSTGWTAFLSAIKNDDQLT